ncbi:hypothetical protein RF11_03357 [Thelohanellus kitauei]|uniref:Uncharacterized protein n=1 Tax=Thelohanellus kitauei TaxID=669202 RepID=A0A0C2IQU4_THEKT|nr:hypothetical protein RF11_03357 [Thelohanellus kitauei]
MTNSTYLHKLIHETPKRLAVSLSGEIIIYRCGDRYREQGYCIYGMASLIRGVYKPTPVHFCTNFTSTANATVSTLVQGSDFLNIHPLLLPTRANLPHRHSFALNLLGGFESLPA